MLKVASTSDTSPSFLSDTQRPGTPQISVRKISSEMKLAPRCREVPDGKLAVYNAGTLRAVGRHKSHRKESAEMLRKRPWQL
jgi:hypothetical protein